MAESRQRYTIAALKARLYAILVELEKSLAEKYPDKRKNLELWIKRIKVKLDRLRVQTLYDYMRTIEAASREFPELAALMPDKEYVMKLLEE